MLRSAQLILGTLAEKLGKYGVKDPHGELRIIAIFHDTWHATDE